MGKRNVCPVCGSSVHVNPLARVDYFSYQPPFVCDGCSTTLDVSTKTRMAVGLALGAMVLVGGLVVVVVGQASTGFAALAVVIAVVLMVLAVVVTGYLTFKLEVRRAASSGEPETPWGRDSQTPSHAPVGARDWRQVAPVLLAGAALLVASTMLLILVGIALVLWAGGI